MRKLSILVVSVLLVGLAACSSDDGGGGEETGATAGASTGATAPTGATAATGATSGPPGPTAATGAMGGDCTEASAADLSGEPAFTVTISGFAFDPECFTASATASFTVENQDGVSHTFTVEGAPIDTAIGGGQSFNSIGATPGLVAGTYGFLCKIHPTMTGTVIFV